jgi:hypothetical protein
MKPDWVLWRGPEVRQGKMQCGYGDNASQAPHRPIQLCIFLKVLLGEKAMVHMMVQAINTAKQVL